MPRLTSLDFPPAHDVASRFTARMILPRSPDGSHGAAALRTWARMDKTTRGNAITVTLGDLRSGFGLNPSTATMAVLTARHQDSIDAGDEDLHGVGIVTFRDHSTLVFRSLDGPFLEGGHRDQQVAVLPRIFRIPTVVRLKDPAAPPFAPHYKITMRNPSRGRHFAMAAHRNADLGNWTSLSGSNPFFLEADFAALRLQILCEAAAFAAQLPHLPLLRRPAPGEELEGVIANGPEAGAPRAWPSFFEHSMIDDEEVPRIRALADAVARILVFRHRDKVRRLQLLLLSGTLCGGDADRRPRIAVNILSAVTGSPTSDLAYAIEREAWEMLLGDDGPIDRGRLVAQTFSTTHRSFLHATPVGLANISVNEVPSAHEAIRLQRRLRSL